MDAAKRVQTQTLRVVYRGGVLDHLVRKTYHIYMHSDPNSACTENTPGLHTQLPQFCMYEKSVFRTRTREAILHVHIWPTVRFRFRFRLYRGGGSGPPCTKNIPHLHALGPQFCMYGKHAWPTCRITPILHVHIWPTHVD